MRNSDMKHKGEIESIANLGAETKCRAITFSTTTTAWHISTTALIPITKNTIRTLCFFSGVELLIPQHLPRHVIV